LLAGREVGHGFRLKETVGFLDVAKGKCLGDDRAQCTRLQSLENKSLGTLQGFWVGHDFCIDIALQG